MLKVFNKINCSGCSACYSICPQKCIEMVQDNEGFLYPVIDESKCINCDLCVKVCPIINKKKEEKFKQYGYILNNKDNNIRKQSTSGGAFTAIAEYVIDNNGIVFGATFDEDFVVYHEYVNKKEELKKFRNSKYVQSEIRNTFKEAKKYLDENKLVLFSGTPCQIEGLKKYLLKDYKNLITLDVVCHAVPSPLVFKKYKKYITDKLGDTKIKEILFRDKTKYGYKYSTMTVKTEKKQYMQGVETDPYLRAFFKNLSDRPSCYECKFKIQYRVSDFTIWDCFEPENFDKKFDDNIGTTKLLIHTNKGKEIFKKIGCKMEYLEVDVEKLVYNVKEIYESVPNNSKREQFFHDIDRLNEKKFFKKYFPDSFKVKSERFIRRTLARTSFYKKIKNIIKNIRKRV